MEGRFDSYNRWNDALIEAFFGQDRAGEPVYLDLEEASLQRAASLAGASTERAADDLTAAVCRTLVVPPEEGRTFNRHAARARAWRAGGRTSNPPFVGLLAFLSLVAERMAADHEFSSANYYGRLCRAVGAVATTAKRRVQRDFMHQTGRLWDELNAWLDDQEGERGIATAFPFDYRVHVGRPISQALVRASDRRRLHEFFRDVQLDAGERLGLADMRELLDEWISESSSTLKRLWSSKEARDQVAAIACVELESWRGNARRGETPDRSLPLLVLACLWHHPIPRLALEFRVHANDQAVEGSYALPMDSTAAALTAFEGAENIRVVDAGSPEWAAIDAPIAWAEALIATFELHPKDPLRTLRRAAKRLVVLRFDPEHRWYVESSRVRLGDRHVLLLHTSLMDALTKLLPQVAAHGYATFAPGQLRGLPEGWCAVTDVLVTAAVDEYPEDLTPLAPLGLTQLAFEDGISLGNRTWHGRRPPRIVVAALSRTPLRLTIRPQDEEDASPRVYDLTPPAVVSAESLANTEGDYTLTLSALKEGKPADILQTARLRVRTADSPRPISAAPLTRVVSDDDLWWVMSAAAESSPARGICGLTNLPPVGLIAAEDLHAPPTNLHELVWHHDEWPAEGSTRSRGGIASGCIVGAHYWLLPTAGRGRPSKRIRGRCKNCGLERWYPTYLRARRETFGAPHMKALLAPSLPAAGVVPVEFDTLLDALSYLRGGSWQALQRIAEQVDDTPWFASEAARTLSALGHIELEVDRRTLRPVRWGIAPTTIALTARDGIAVIAGFRSSILVHALNHVVAGLGGTVSIQTSHAAPTVLRIEGLGGTTLSVLAEKLSALVGEDVAFADSCSAALLPALPRLSDLYATLPVTDSPHGRAELLMIKEGKWLPCEAVVEPGAYRIATFPNTYLLQADHESLPRVVDTRLARYLAASIYGLALMAYDSQRQEIRVPFGGQLPGLYERAVVACSGEPAMRDGSTIVYRDVPPETAAILWDKLAPRPLPPEKLHG